MSELILSEIKNLLQKILGGKVRTWFASRKLRKRLAKIVARNGIAGDEERYLDLSSYELPNLTPIKRSSSDSLSRAIGNRLQILDLLSAHNFVVVLGDPGSGKSTLLKFLQGQYLNNYRYKGRRLRLFPVLLRIRDWAQSGLNFVDYLNSPDVGGLIAAKDGNNPLSIMFGEGKLLILLDGLDEAGLDYDRMLNSINKLGQECAVGNKIVATTRKTGYHTALPRFDHFELDGLSDEQVSSIAKRVLRGALSADAFLEVAQQVTELEAYVRNPFMLQLLLRIYHDNGESLPATKVAILDKSTERLLRIKESNTFEREQKLKWAKSFLQKLASGYLDDVGFESVSFESVTATIAGIANKQKENGEKARVYLESIVQTTGVIWESQRGVFSFMHRSFMEYYCGSFLASISDPIKRLRPMYFLSEYEEVIRFMMASYKHDHEYRDDKKANALVKDILDQKPWQFELLKQPELLAGLCIGEYGEGIAPKFCNRVQNCLIELTPQIQSSAATDKIHTIAFLWGGSKEMLEVAIKWQAQFDSSPNPMERLTLINALNAIGPQNQKVMQFLASVFENDAVGFIRDRALECLCLWHEMKHVSAERLFDILILDPEAVSGITLEDVFAELAGKDPNIKVRLMNIALEAKESVTRERVYDIFQQKQFHSPRMVDFLLKGLASEKDEFAAQSIASCLMEMDKMLKGINILRCAIAWAKTKNMGVFLPLSVLLSKWHVFRIVFYRRIFERRISQEISEAVIWSTYWKPLGYPGPKVISLILAELKRDPEKHLAQWLDYLEDMSQFDPQINEWLNSLAKQVSAPFLNLSVVKALIRTRAGQDDNATITVRLLATSGVSPNIRAGALVHLYVDGKIPLANLKTMIELFPECITWLQIEILKVAGFCEDESFAFQWLIGLLPSKLSDEVFKQLVDSISMICPNGQETKVEEVLLDAFIAEQNLPCRYDPSWEKSQIRDWQMVLLMETCHRRTILFDIIGVLAEVRQEKYSKQN